MEPSRYLLKTFGCKANLYDSQLLEAELQKRGWQPGTYADAKLCFVNSCSVTDEADRQTRRMASRLARENPDARVIVTGCTAEVDSERLQASKGIHYVVGNQDKPRLLDLVFEQVAKEKTGEEIKDTVVLGSTVNYEEMASRHPEDRDWPLPEASFELPPAHLRGEAGRTRAFLKIQEGCNAFCTYCVIPYGRGPSRSLDVEGVVARVQSLVDQGVREIVITGTNIGDYGTDFAEEPQLELLLETIFQKTAIERLRVSSLDPAEITPRLLELMKSEPRFCPHFHVSLQSPHSRILKLMKRKYREAEVERTLKAIAELPAPVGGPFVGMDLITGFPGETDEEFDWGVQSLRDLPWSRLHVFPYSERAATPATRLPNSVPKQKRVERARSLLSQSLQRLSEHYEEVLTTFKAKPQIKRLQVLLEGPSRGPDGTKDFLGGYTENYLRVLVPRAGNEHLVNQIVSVTPLSIQTQTSSGDVFFLGSIS